LSGILAVVAAGALSFDAAAGAANTIYGIMLILFIIFMPRGIVGMIEDTVKGRWRGKAAFYSVIRRPSSADQ
jgi:ABC-type branched-subunit amino acid transport system permease subunit